MVNINAIQQIQLDLIKSIGIMDNFNGPEIYNDLIKHSQYWESALIDRLDSLIKLRDLRSNFWNCDTLFIIPVKGKEAANLLGSSDMNAERQVLKLWWD